MKKKRHRIIRWRRHVWSRWQDSNLRPLGYEPHELAAAPHRNVYIIYYTSTIPKSSSFSNFFFGISRPSLLTVEPDCRVLGGEGDTRTVFRKQGVAGAGDDGLLDGIRVVGVDVGEIPKDESLGFWL